MAEISWALLFLAGLVLIGLASMAWANMVITISTVITEPNEGQGIATSQTVTVVGDGPILATVEIGASAANVEVLVPFDTAALKGLLLLADRDMTVYTNEASGSSPDDTIPLTAGSPWLWYLGSGVSIDDLITGDSGAVAKLFVTNEEDVAGVLRVRGVQDITPTP